MVLIFCNIKPLLAQPNTAPELFIPLNKPNNGGWHSSEWVEDISNWSDFIDKIIVYAYVV